MILFILFLLPSLNFQVYTLLHIQSIYLPSPCLSTLEHFNNSSENFSHFLYCCEKYNSTPFLSTQCFLYFLVNHYQICHCTLQMSLFNYSCLSLLFSISIYFLLKCILQQLSFSRMGLQAMSFIMKIFLFSPSF